MYTTYFLCNIFNALKHFCFACLTKWNSENLSVQRSPGPFCRESQWEIFSACPPPLPLSALWVWYEIPGNSFRNAKDSKRSRHGWRVLCAKKGDGWSPALLFNKRSFNFFQPISLASFVHEINPIFIGLKMYGRISYENSFWNQLSPH